MASVYQRGPKWWVGYTDATGRRCAVATGATTKTEARKIAAELEHRADRQRLGLEALPSDSMLTVRAVCHAWLAGMAGRASFETAAGAIRRHLDGSLADLSLARLTRQAVEVFLDGKAAAGLAPETVNKLRGILCAAINRARRTGTWTGPNVVADVPKRKVPRRPPAYLRAEEVAPLLQALAPHWRPLFATAIFTGLRPSELRALRKLDVDLDRRWIVVCRSGGRNVTKGNRVDGLPIAEELVPYLEAALAASGSELVFPGRRGAMLARATPFSTILRRAMGRAGLVTGWKFTCRRCKARGEQHVERHPNKAARACDKCGMKLWPTPEVRPLRFYDATRHTTASLLLQRGAPLQAVQKIMRHSTPTLTTEVYGHLAGDYLRAEINRLTFGLAKPEDVPEGAPVPELLQAAGGGDAPGHYKAATEAPGTAIGSVATPLGSLVPERREAERVKGVEPSTSTLARLHSTTELHPQRTAGS